MKSIHRFAWCLCPVSTLISASCVPSGTAPPYDAGATSTSSTAAFRPSLGIMNAPFEDSFDRPDASESALPVVSIVSDGGTNEAGADAEASAMPVDRTRLGPNWVAMKTTAWKVENGKLCVQNAHNHGIWLNRTLPVNARIEFDATAFSDDGDLKTEVWGDGTSYATGTSYTNASSYLAILGGWKNSLQVLARLNEHGTDRREIKVDKEADDPRQRPVQKGQTYHFKIERNDGKTIRWYVDGVEMFSWVDSSPLAGQGHDHFGFNEWEAKVCFDNVKVTPL